MYTYTVYTINMYFNTFFGKVWFETEFGCFLFESNGSTYELNQATFESQQNPKKIVWKITFVFSEKRTLFLPFCNLKAYIIPAGSPQKISSLLQWPEFTRKLWMSTKRALWWNSFFFCECMNESNEWDDWIAFQSHYWNANGVAGTKTRENQLLLISWFAPVWKHYYQFCMRVNFNKAYRIYKSWILNWSACCEQWQSKASNMCAELWMSGMHLTLYNISDKCNSNWFHKQHWNQSKWFALFS